MDLKNRIEVKFKEVEKCHLICDVDCPIGSIYDYACALQSFCMERMKEAQKAQEAQKASEEKPQEV